MNFKEKLELTVKCYEEMELILNTCEKFDSNWSNPWKIFWNDFREVSRRIPFEIDWDNPDGSYKDDMKARFRAIEFFVEQLEGES